MKARFFWRGGKVFHEVFDGEFRFRKDPRKGVNYSYHFIFSILCLRLWWALTVETVSYVSQANKAGICLGLFSKGYYLMSLPIFHSVLNINMQTPESTIMIYNNRVCIWYFTSSTSTLRLYKTFSQE